MTYSTNFPASTSFATKTFDRHVHFTLFGQLCSLSKFWIVSDSFLCFCNFHSFQWQSKAIVNGELHGSHFSISCAREMSLNLCQAILLKLETLCRFYFHHQINEQIIKYANIKKRLAYRLTLLVYNFKRKKEKSFLCHRTVRVTQDSIFTSNSCTTQHQAFTHSLIIV